MKTTSNTPRTMDDLGGRDRTMAKKEVLAKQNCNIFSHIPSSWWPIKISFLGPLNLDERKEREEQAGFVEPHSSSTIGWVEVGSGLRLGRGWVGVKFLVPTKVR